MVNDQDLLQNSQAEATIQFILIRRRFLESVSAVLLTLAIIALPLSLARIHQTGINPEPRQPSLHSTYDLYPLFHPAETE